MDIVNLQRDDHEAAWNEYVDSSGRSTFFHRLGWKNAIERAYGFRSHYLMAMEDGRVKGILPLTHGRSRFFGSFRATGLYCSHGGVCADDQGTGEALIGEAVRLTREVGAGYLEVKNYDFRSEDLLTKDRYCTLVIRLDEDPVRVWEDKVHRYRRRDVKRARKNGLDVRVGGLELLDDYFAVLSRSMRDLGTPVHSYDFYRTLFEEFEDGTKIFVVSKGGRAVAAVNVFFFKDRVYPQWGGSLKEYRGLYPNELMYWSAIEYACENGYRYFDFGRSQWNSGTFRFKSRWGAEAKPLYYQYYLNREKAVPDIDPTNPRYRLYIGIWKRMPLLVANRIGPRIIRYIP